MTTLLGALVDKNPEVASLALGRARRFLKKLTENPFIAIVVDENNERVHVYHTTGLDADQISAVRQLLDEIEASLED